MLPLIVLVRVLKLQCNAAFFTVLVIQSNNIHVVKASDINLVTITLDIFHPPKYYKSYSQQLPLFP